MFLAIDVGNSHTSFGVFHKKKLQYLWNLPTRTHCTPDEIASFLLPLFNYVQISTKDWRGVGMSSVVPSVNESIHSFSKTYLGLGISEVSSLAALPFKLSVNEPHSVGADRIANVAFAREHLKLPAIVVDFGTATTLDIVSKAGDYEGGTITPGIKLSFEALSHKAAQLPSVLQNFPSSVIGKSTASCMQAGILFGYIDLVEGLLRRCQDEMGESATVALTGGYSKLLSGHLNPQYEYFPHLTLEGIRLLTFTD